MILHAAARVAVFFAILIVNKDVVAVFQLQAYGDARIHLSINKHERGVRNTID